MALLEKFLVVRTSQLPKSGNGLYTKVQISKGTRIVEYKGRIQPWREVKAEDGHNGYLMYLTRNTVINALHSIKTFGRYANDASGLIKIKGLRNNAESISEGRRCYIDATRTIQAGEEILVGYGREYWTLIKKISKEKSKEISSR